MKSEAGSEPDSEYDSDCEQQLVHIRDWLRFLRKFKRIRRLQLIFNATGCALKDNYCPEVRQWVRKIYKIEWKEWKQAGLEDIQAFLSRSGSSEQDIQERMNTTHTL